MSNKKPAKAVDMEQLQKQLQELLAKGKKEGMIRAADLNALLEKMTLTTEAIETGVGIFTVIAAIAMGVTVIYLLNDWIDRKTNPEGTSHCYNICFLCEDESSSPHFC